MSNDTRTIDLVVNNLTEEQFENVFSPDPNELWLTPDDTPEQLAQKVDKTSDPSKIYGTDAQGNQTTYDKSGFQDKLTAGTDLAFSYVSEDLPEGYTKLEYIESTGTQYIDTGVVGNLNTEYEITVKNNYIYSSGSFAIFGSRTGATENNITSFFSVVPDQPVPVVINDFGNYTITRQNPTVSSEETLHKYKLTNSKSKRTITNLDTGWTETVTTTYSGSLTTPTNLYIGYAGSFGGLANISNLQGRIYSCKIWDNGTLVRDLVPCLDEYDRPGLYDLVNQQMYYNAGTGAFLSGPIMGSLKLDFTNESGYALRSEIPTTFVFDQAESATTWHIAHNLGKYPSVVIVDSTGAVIGGKVTYVDINNIDIEFNAQFTGKAYLN